MRRNLICAASLFAEAKRCCLLIAVFLTMGLQVKADVFQQIIDNVVKRELATCGVSTQVNRAKTYTASIKADGSWSDIDYASTSQTNWPAIAHLDRVKALAVAYVAPESELNGNVEIYNQIVNALNYWYAKKPTSTNWYNWEIGWPQRMGVILCLMRSGEKQVPTTTESNILSWQKSISKGPNQSGSQGTGANKMDIALQWIYRTALQKDQTNLDFAINQFFLPIKFNSGEGLQSDYSYLQHGMQLYAGGYGGSVLTATMKVAYYLVGTTYEEQGDYIDYISNFVRLGYLPSVRGQYMSFNNVGRSVADQGGTSRSGFSSITTSLAELDAANAEAFNNATLRLTGKKAASFGIEPMHRHYWRADYAVHQRPGYTIDVRTASTRTLRCENGNGANLKGYFMTEGGTWIARTGREYADISVVWDWAHVPGITVPAVTSIPQPAQWGTSGQSTFTGGVSDGMYGATTYAMNNTEYGINTQAKKSWFFFDNEVVCLGAGISSSNANAVHTTINQCFLNGDVKASAAASSEEETLGMGQFSRSGALWVNHDSISYYVPETQQVQISNATQTGTWKAIDSAVSNTTEQKKDVFKMWINHGAKPTDGAYAYYIIPNTGSIREAKSRMDSLIVVNTDSVQAVYNPALGMVQAIFYRAAKLNVGEMEISATNSCATLFRDVNTKAVKAFVSDPSYRLDSLTIYAKFPALKYKQLGCRLNTQTMYEGSTSSFVIDETTPDSVYRPVESIALNASSVSLTKESLCGELKAELSPANATHKEIRWESSDEKVVRVDQSGRLLALRSGEADIVATAADGVKAVCHVSVAPGIASSFTTADAYVYDKQGTTNYGATGSLTVRNDGSGYRRGAYARFPLAALDSIDLADGDVKVNLVFQVTYGADKVNEVKWTVSSLKTQNWTENAVTWNNGPATLAQIATAACFKPQTDWKKNFVSFDITNYALAQHAQGAEDVSVYIYQNARASGGKGTSEFASRENANAYVMAPRLVAMGSELTTGVNSLPDSSSKVNATIQGNVLYLATPCATTATIYAVGGAVQKVFRTSSAGVHAFPVADLVHGVYILKIEGNSFKLMK